MSNRLQPELDVLENTRATLIEYSVKRLAVIFSDRHRALLRLVIAERQRFPDLARVYYERGPKGSRELLVKYMLPFFGSIADLVNSQVPNLNWVLVKSNFISLEFLTNLPEVNDGRPIEGNNLHYDFAQDHGALFTTSGTRIDIWEPAKALKNIDIALTIPGTSTAELAAKKAFK